MDYINKYKCKEGCPNDVTEELLNNEIRPKIDSLYSNKLTSARIQVYEQEDINFGYDIHGGVFTMCTQEILMIDFDYKDGFTDKKATRYIREFTDFLYTKYKYEMLFAMYKTDRGIHAFLVNRLFHFTSPEALKIMIDLCSDPYYIGYSEVRGFCIRLSAKIKNFDKSEIKQIITDEFISLPYEEFLIGYGKPLEYVENVLNFHIGMIRILKQIYLDYLDEFITKTYIVESDSYDIFPSERMFKLIKNITIQLLKDYKLFKESSKYITAIRRQKLKTIKIYEQFGINLFYNIELGDFYMCSSDILKMKIIVKETSEKFQIIEDLKNNTDNTFWIYENDKKLIIYLVDSYEGNSNFYKHILERYIKDKYPGISIDFSNFCENLNTEENIVFKKKINDVIKIGEKEINEGILCTLMIQNDIMEFITNLYENNEMVIENKYVNEVYDVIDIPSDKMFQMIKNKFIDLLNDYEIKDDEITYKNSAIKKHLVNSYRYTDLFDQTYLNKFGQDAVDNYSRTSVIQAQKNDLYKDKRFNDEFKFKGIDHWTKNVLGPYLLSNSKNQIILLNGPLYPFILGFDLTRKLLYIRFYDLMMLDWDTHDGIPKSSPILLIDRFLNWQKTLPKNKQIALEELCFKFYETDNGIHAFVVSHKMIFYLDNSSICMIHTCCDFYYATMAKYYGYSIRLNPKIQNADTSLKEIEDIKSQFTQKIGVSSENENKLKNSYKKNKDGRITYIGNLKAIDPYLDSLTDFVYNIQLFISNINKNENLREKINNVEPSFLEGLRNFTSNYYNTNIRDKNNEFISVDQKEWSTGSNSFYYGPKNLE